MTRFGALALLVVASFVPTFAFAQIIGVPVQNGQGAGVYVDADGTVRQRQMDKTGDVAAQRLRAKALNQAPKSQALTYVSMKKLLEELKSVAERKGELPDNVRFLSGITQVKYLFVFPEEHDLVIAGISEPLDATEKLQPIGKTTGRPVIHLDDLVTALRGGSGDRQHPFGCSIDPTADALAKTNQVMKDLANATRGARMNAMKEAIGLQKVSLRGVPVDSRTAFVTVAADYKLKRMCLGLDPIPVPGIGSPVDSSRAAGNRFWFEASYLPVLVSPEGDAYELRGPRLVLQAGAFSFDPKGATPTAQTFAKNFSAKFDKLATVTPLFADLQNITDLSVIAALIRKDNLAQKAGLDLSWLMSESNYKGVSYPTPLTAETVVNFTNGSIVAGGVTLEPSKVVAESNREKDAKQTLKIARARPESDNWSKTIEPETARTSAKK